MRRLRLASVVVFLFACSEESEDGGEDLADAIPATDVLPDVEVPDADAPDLALPPDSTPDTASDVRLDSAPPPDARADDIFVPSPDAATPDAAASPAPACANDEDDDGDGHVDYPADPGCANDQDDDETDPPTPACADGLDNDGDGEIDLDDPGCASIDDPNEESACADVHTVRDISAADQVAGSTAEQPAVFVAGCRNNLAPEAVFLFTLRVAVERLVFDTTGSTFDTVLSVRTACADLASEIACNDDTRPGQLLSRIELVEPDLGDYYVLLDGHGRSAGDFVLTVRAEIADGTPCPEPGGPVTCRVGAACVEGVCTPAVCSDGEDNDDDGRIDYPAEPGCESPEDHDEQDPPTPPQCSDGLDNDFNGLIDWPDDSRCESAADPAEQPLPQCSDGVDNDQDGLIDLADPGCNADPGRQSEFNVDACRDRVDNDEDGRIDFPHDPGCEGPTDPDESDPDPLPECADGIDNDGDGAIDFPDDVDGCTFAADPTESDPCEGLEVREITGLGEVRGTTAQRPNEFRASCVEQTGPEEVLLWDVREDRPLEGMRLTTRNSRFNTVVHVRTACDGPLDEELACDNSSGPSGSSVVELGPQPVGTRLYIVVDGASGDARGVYRLQVRADLSFGARCDGGDGYQCAEGLGCRPDSEGVARCVVAACSDGLDNDGDGLTDFPEEPGCDQPGDDDERDPAERPICSNGIDDDGDGLLDFGADPRCTSAADPSEEAECSDRLDNDDDGALDYDRDGDGFRDANADSGCACATDEEESRQPQCRDFCDNDLDGLIDLADPGCQDDPDRDSEFNIAECRDGADNDGDGWTDFPNDPGCLSTNDQFELDPVPPPACADGVDNDGDGLVDFERGQGHGDDGCNSAGDTDEIGPCDRDQPTLDVTGIVNGNTLEAMHEHRGQCTAGDAPDRTFVASVPYPAHVVIHTFGSRYDTVLYARRECRPQTVCPPAAPEPDAGIVPDSAVDASIADATAPDASLPDALPVDAVADASPSPVDAISSADSFSDDDGVADVAPVLVDAVTPDAAALDVVTGDAASADLRVVNDAHIEDGPAHQEKTDDEGADEPCAPVSTEIACNDDRQGLQSQIEFDWAGGDIYVFVDGFGSSSGEFVLTLEAVYALGDQCGPSSPDYAACADGLECRADAMAEYPTCQARR